MLPRACLSANLFIAAGRETMRQIATRLTGVTEKLDLSWTAGQNQQHTRVQ
jgi:hypothetical protein